MASPGPTRRWYVTTPASMPEAILDEFRAEWHTEAIRCHVEGKIQGIYPFNSILLEACDEVVETGAATEPLERADDGLDDSDPPVIEYLAAMIRRKNTPAARAFLVKR